MEDLIAFFVVGMAAYVLLVVFGVTVVFTLKVLKDLYLLRFKHHAFNIRNS